MHMPHKPLSLLTPVALVTCLGLAALGLACGDSSPVDEVVPDAAADEPPDYDLLFQDGVVQRIDIEIGAADHQAMMDDLAALFPAGGMGSFDADPIYVPVTVRFGDRTWSYVGMRYKGNSSLRTAWQTGVRKLSFRLNFDKYEDVYPETTNQKFHGFKEMTFSNGFKDPSLIRDKTAADIFRAAGVPAARSAFIRVYVDVGEGPVYFGLYTMIEDPSDAMLDAQFADGSGNLYKPEGESATWGSFAAADFEKKTNETSGFEDVQAAITALNADRADAAAWRAGLEAAFDVAGFLRVLAVNQTMVNWDSYGCIAHNYYLYGDPSAGGRLVWFPWDLNEALYAGMTPPNCYPQSVMLDEVGTRWPLIRNLLDDPTYRAAYQAELTTVVNGAFATAAVEAQLDANHALISPYVIGPEAIETPPYTFLRAATDFPNALPTLHAHVEQRQTAVRQALGL